MFRLGKNGYSRLLHRIIFGGFNNRFQNINWDSYYTDLPFNPSALSLYKWAPIAEELKTLDRKIVLNSMILKWDVIKQEFQNLIQF